MTIYVFETMTQGDAAGFTAADSLTFATKSATATQVTVAPYTNGQGGSLGNSGISVTYGGKNLVFSDGLASASQQTADNGGIQFRDGSYLILGSSSGDNSYAETDTTLTVPASSATAASVVYGLGGSDYIIGGDGNNYLYGGNDDTTPEQLAAGNVDNGEGGDTISAGDGNNHIFGNSAFTRQGAKDGNDQIIVGGGSNYINGNGGADYIQAGSVDANGAGSTGNNRLFGGAGDDFIYVRGAGVNAVNGNTGDDVVLARDATGNNLLRGGMGNDLISAGHGHDVVMGDTGNDIIYAGTGSTSGSGSSVTYGHLTIMTGGTGADLFQFAGKNGEHPTSEGDAGVVSAADHTHSGIIVGGKAYYQTITDFTQGVDTIHIFAHSFSGTDLVQAQDGITFTSVKAAEVYAQQILDNHTLSSSTSGSTTTAAAGEVAAIDVNGNTYLFYHAAGGETPSNGIDSIIQLNGVTASTLSQSGTGTPSFS